MKKLSSHNKALVALALISITWGTTWLPSKLLVDEYSVPPMQISALRMFIAGLVYTVIFWFKDKRMPTGLQLAKIFVLSLFFIVFANAFSLRALSYKKIGSGIGAVLGATVPLWVAALSIFIFRKQKITGQILAGLTLGIAGIIVIFSNDLHVFTKREYLEPILFSTLASITWSIGTILNAKKDESLNPFFSLGLQMLLGSFVLYGASLVFEQRINFSQINSNGWMAFAYLVVIGSFISFASYMYALKHLPATQVSMYAYINPLVALVLGFFWRKESNFEPEIIAGTLIVLAGVYLVNRGFEKQKFEEE